MVELEISSSFFISLAVTDTILASLTVLGNLLLLATIFLDPLSCLRTPTTYFVVNLAISDLLTGFIVGYGRAIVEYCIYLNKVEPKWIEAALNSGGGVSLKIGICTVVLISFDRHLAVSDPLHYSDRVTARRVKICILCSWLYACSLAAFYPIAGESWPVFLLAYSHTHFTIPVFVLLAVYLRIFRSLSRRRTELFRLATSISTITLRHRLERERKMALAMFAILLLFCASFLPFYIKIQLLNFCPCLESVHYRKFDFLSHNFLYLSSLLDPFMYAWRVPKFQRSLLRCLRIRKRNAVGLAGATYSR